MDSLGHRFQAARESQGLTLEQIASTTKVREYYLKALEEDRFDRLPQKVFAKGFVRSYARSLGLDEAECVRLFLERSASFYKEEEDKQQYVLQRMKGDRKSKINRNAVLMVTGVVFLGVLFLLPREQSGPTKPPPESEAARDASPPLLERQPGGSTASQTTTAKKTGASQPSASESPAVASKPSPPSVVSVQPESFPGAGSEKVPLLLELQASELTWVVVRSDDGEPVEALLQPGEIAQWRAQDRFFLTLGNAGGVTAKLNGQPRGPFGTSGAVVRNVELKP